MTVVWALGCTCSAVLALRLTALMYRETGKGRETEGLETYINGPPGDARPRASHPSLSLYVMCPLITDRL